MDGVDAPQTPGRRPPPVAGLVLAQVAHVLLFGDPGMRWARYPVRVLLPTLLTVGPVAALVALA